jgi:hypothetical protein
MRSAILLTFVLGCIPPGTVIVSPQPAPAPTTETQADNRVSGQVFIDNIAQAGYTCKDWMCWNPRPSADRFALSTWKVVIAYDDASTGPQWPVYIKSMAPRAFGQQCAAMANYLSDLIDANNGFQVFCDDASQQFVMTTTVNLPMDADTSRQWLEQHVANRLHAWKLLNSVGAIGRTL